jgi:hypothetical protein
MSSLLFGKQSRLIVGLFLGLLVGCNASSFIDAPSEFRVPATARGESVEAKLLIRHHGTGQLKFGKFKVELSEEFKLDWCAIDSQTGKAFGPPRIAGFHNGRVVFPNVLDLLPGQDLLLMLTYTPTTDTVPTGRISMASNDPARPQLEIVVRPVSTDGG